MAVLLALEKDLGLLKLCKRYWMRGVHRSCLTEQMFTQNEQYRCVGDVFHELGGSGCRFQPTDDVCKPTGIRYWISPEMSLPLGRWPCRIEPRLYKRNDAYLIGLAVSSYECNGGDECTCPSV